MKLKQLFEEEILKQKKNNYYNINLPDDYDSSTFSNKDTLFNIFRKIMTTSQKEGIDFDFLDLIKHEKRSHSYSLFLIGLRIFKENNLLKSVLENRIKTIKNKIESQFKLSFEYLWLLVCIYHDIGSSLEQKPEHLFRFKTKSLSANIQFYFPYKRVFDIDIYKDNWREYFNYRLSKDVLDHGILGGLLFYSELKKKYKKLRKKQHNDFFITQNNIGWSKKLLEQVHGYVAWIIISHNMWFINHSEEKEKKQEIKEYQDFKLNDFIINNKQRLFIDSDPFLFHLCLIDSIDPIKKIATTDFSSDKILESIDIEVKNNEIIIVLSGIPEKTKKRYIHDIRDLEKWLGVSVTESIDSQKITIKIENKATGNKEC